MNRTFAAFLIGLAKRGRRDARSAALYVGKRTDGRKRILERVDAALKAGKIDAEWHRTLTGYLDALGEEFIKSGRTVDERDPREWNDLGNGARVRKVIKDSEED